MQSEKIIDIDSLVEKISEEVPQGVDVRTDTQTQSLYYDLKEIRHNLRQQEDEILLNEDQQAIMPSWQAVIEQTINLLSKHTKDLEIAAWLVEGLVREHAYQGLIVGCQLLKHLVDQYAEIIYPEADEDGDVSRLLAVAMLNGSQYPGTVTSAINLAPVIELTEHSLTIWELYQLQGLSSEQLAEHPLVKSFESVSQEQKSLIVETWQQSLIAITELDTALTNAYSKQAPSLAQLTQAISGSLKMFKHILNTFYPDESSEPEILTEKTIESDKAVGRQIAINAIKTALEYYQHTEPHSPILYLLQRSLRWSEQSLQQILSEIIVHEELEFDFARILGMPSMGHHSEKGKS